MNLSDRVRANVLHLLEARGWTYSDLGRDFAVPWSRHYVWHVLKDKRNTKGFSATRIDDFAAALKVDVAELCKIPPGFRATEESDR